MIKRRLSLGFSLLWRTYVVYFIFTFVFSLVVGFAFSDLLAANRGLMLFVPAIAMVLFALLLVILEAGCCVNLLRAVFGGRLKRSPAEWRTYVLLLALLIAALGVLNALVVRLAPVDIWVNYKAYGASLLFVVGVFAIGFTQATPDAAEPIAEPAEDPSTTGSTPN